MPKFSVRGIWERWRESYHGNEAKADDAVTVFTGVSHNGKSFSYRILENCDFVSMFGWFPNINDGCLNSVYPLEWFNMSEHSMNSLKCSIMSIWLDIMYLVSFTHNVVLFCISSPI